MNVSAPYIARRLSGKVDWSQTDLERAADILNVPVSRFFPSNDGARRRTGHAA